MRGSVMMPSSPTTLRMGASTSRENVSGLDDGDPRMSGVLTLMSVRSETFILQYWTATAPRRHMNLKHGGAEKRGFCRAAGRSRCGAGAVGPKTGLAEREGLGPYSCL